MDTTLNNLDELNKKLHEESALILYFSSPTCSVCHVLRPKLMQQLQQSYPSIGRYNVNIAITPEIASEFQVFSAPAVIVFFEGKEFIRKGRAISVDGLLQEIKRPYELISS